MTGYDLMVDHYEACLLYLMAKKCDIDLEDVVRLKIIWEEVAPKRDGHFSNAYRDLKMFLPVEEAEWRYMNMSEEISGKLDYLMSDPHTVLKIRWY